MSQGIKVVAKSTDLRSMALIEGRIVPRNRHVLTRNYYETTADLYGYTTAVRIGCDPWSRDKITSLGKPVGIHP